MKEPTLVLVTVALVTASMLGVSVAVYIQYLPPVSHQANGTLVEGYWARGTLAPAKLVWSDSGCAFQYNETAVDIVRDGCHAEILVLGNVLIVCREKPVGEKCVRISVRAGEN